MAKFNKDRFFNTVTEEVQQAINTHLLTEDDYDTDNKERLHGFIQFVLLKIIENRKFAVDVLDDFNYDDKTPWPELEQKFGEFKSLMDIALVNLWCFLESQGATEYGYYHKAGTDAETPILDIARDDTNFGQDEQAPEQTKQMQREISSRPERRMPDNNHEEDDIEESTYGNRRRLRF